MNALIQKLRLTDEQNRILQEIRDKINEFHNAGGYLYAIDYDSDFCAVNTLEVESVSLFYDEDRDDYEQDGYIAMNDAAQLVPISIPIVSEYFDLCVKPKRNKNLF